MAAGITPPGSVFEPPLTPPPTAEKPLSTEAQRVVNQLRLHRANSSTNLLGLTWRIRSDTTTISVVIIL
ncbi:hypothetical protein ACN38_g6330 [Penicillium nordicum]|uniref:Uncharacterized protein n=1 Tax=Penicillium nordicum TaxID=229535 RepID=A0A0M9WFD8_9EURO|nr:hypothetical protein ACN38_g6330 [Penicillium nordicum]